MSNGWRIRSFAHWGNLRLSKTLNGSLASPFQSIEVEGSLLGGKYLRIQKKIFFNPRLLEPILLARDILGGAVSERRQGGRGGIGGHGRED